MIQAVLFDADGVLIDSLAAHLSYTQDWSERHGLNIKVPSPEEFKQLIRRGTTVSPMETFFLACGFPEASAKSADLDYAREFMVTHRPERFPGVPIMLANLCQARLPLGIVTANTMGNIRASIGPFMGLFEKTCLFSREMPGFSKPASIRTAAEGLGIPVQDILYVGDQYSDAGAAHLAACRFLGVSYGWAIQQEDEVLHGYPVVCSPQGITDYVLGQM